MNSRAIWGALVGDACGATLEFYDDEITEEVARRAMTMPGGGSLRVGPGQITDDGELTLALWSVLRERGPAQGFPLEAMAKAYAAWYASFPFDIGRTCSLAFDMLHEWVHDEKKELTYVLRSIHEMSRLSEANGALMRVTPIATWWVSHPLRMYGGVCVEQTAQFAAASAEEDASLSHPGRVTRDANAVYTYAMTLLLLGCSPAETVERVEIMVRKRCAEVQRWVEESKKEWEGLSDARVLIGHVRHAFVAALWFLRRPEIGYEEAICMVLQRGGDTDTNAAIVGGLVACYQPIPEAMKAAVARFDCLIETNSSMDLHRAIGRQRPKEYSVKYQMGP
jgi:ADP-ribosyl-[dinitrogen reductase] hydrolase